VNIRRVAAVVGASVRMFRRDRPAFFFTFAFPIMFMVLFGLILGGSGTSRPTIDVVGSGPLRQALDNSRAIKVKAQPDAAHALRRVANGDEPAAVILSGNRAHLVYAQSSQVEAPIAIGITRGIVDEFNLDAAHAARAITLTSAHVEAQSLSYVDLLVPGLLAMAIAQSAAFGVAFSLVAWRQKGMLRHLRLTPLPLREFAAGRIIFHLIIALIQAVILLTVGRVVFGVHLVGSALALIPLILIGSISFVALGMCIGGRANTEDATAALSNLIVLPMVFLGGVFFPISSAPPPIRVIAHFLPLTYLAQGLQDVAVRGDSFVSTLPDLAALAIFAVLLSGLALRLFRWQTTVA
jgi:ABC-2 type transport system permease protein